jgi:histone acetyltransferase
MNKLKDHAQKEGIQYFMTYADNNAIEFFKKQGFNKEEYMPQSRWKGYIKDYNGSTLMQCKIMRDVDFVNISEILKQQRDAIIAKIHSVISLKK